MAISIATTTTNPLAGTTSFLVQKTGGANDQGKGVSTEFSVDLAYRAKVLNISFDYIVNSGTFTAGSNTTDSDLIVYLYDISNSQLIEPSSFKLLSNSSTVSDTFKASFQTNYNSSSYRLIFHQATITTNNYELKIDNVTVSPTNLAFGTPITDWRTFTPTGSWTGTATYSGFWRRVGDSVEVRTTVDLTGAATAANLTVNLPSGLTIDTTKLNVVTNGNNIVGVARYFDTGLASYGPSSVVYNSTTSVLLQYSSVASNSEAPVTNTSPFTFGNTDQVKFNYTVPILGWSSSVQVSDGYEGRQVTATMGLSGNQAIATTAETKVTLNSSILDKAGMVDTTNNRIKIKSSGTYMVSAAGYFNAVTAGQFIQLIVKKNGSTAVSAGFRYSGGTDEGLVVPAIPVDLVADDYLEMFATSGDSSYSIFASAASTYLSVTKPPGSPTISATETVSALYTGAPPTGTLGAAYNIVTFGTKVKDTHGSYASGAYTVPASGQYDISAQIGVIGTWSAGKVAECAIFIDGVLKYRKYVEMYGASTNSVPSNISINSIPLIAGQAVTIRSYTDATAPTYSSNATENFFSITRSGGY